ncbi:MAG: TolB family protein [Phycisphaeraceae bacterium]
MTSIPNAGLQLPPASPGGTWVAFLDVVPASPGDVSATLAQPDPDSLLTGERLDSVSLHLTQARPSGARRTVVERGAAWPAFTPDGAFLTAVVHEEAGSDLLIHEIATGRNQRLELGLGRLIAPAVSPDRRRLVVAAHQGDPGHARLHVVEFATEHTQPVPLAAERRFQLCGQWLSDQTLVYLAGGEAGVELRRWTLGAPGSEKLADLAIQPATAAGAVQALAAIARPVGPEQRELAYYAAERDRIEVVDLETAATRALPTGSRAGCWVGPGRIVTSARGDLLLCPRTGPVRRLLEGQMLPLWGGADPVRLLLAQPAEASQWEFELLRLEVRRP